MRGRRGAQLRMVAKVPCNIICPPLWQLDTGIDGGAAPRRFSCLTAIVGQIIYYSIFGILGACRRPHTYLKNRMGAAWYGDSLL
jgi:hypothetical protein